MNRNPSQLWLHRASIIAILPFVTIIAAILCAIIGPVVAVFEVFSEFRKAWGDEA